MGRSRTPSASARVERETALRWLRRGGARRSTTPTAAGVVHRDIKPGNLLLDHERVLYVADFGIARSRTEDTITTTGQLFGTAAYLSPEQALGRPATEASDRYALAVVAFELLVGQRPFTAEHFAAQARQHIEQRAAAREPSQPDLPPAVDVVLARGMAKASTEDRWETAGGVRRRARGRCREPAPPSCSGASWRRGTASGAAPHAPARPRAPRPVISVAGLDHGRSPSPLWPRCARCRRRDRSTDRRLAGAQSGADSRRARRSTPAGCRRRAPPGAPHEPDPSRQAAGAVRTPQRPAATPARGSATPPPSADALEARGHH